MSTILVIEDEEAVRANLVEMLEAEGYQVLQAADGQLGVHLARGHLPDVILCDITMPKLDGYGVLDALRQIPSTATLPFIFTARADRSDMRQGMNMGADDYLTKPFTRDELLWALSTRLNKQAAIAHKVQNKLDELRGSIALALPHEFRTPLTSILGYTAFLLEDYATLKPEEVYDMVQSVHGAAQRLQGLIINFLLYAELEVAARDLRYADTLMGDDLCPVKMAVAEAALEQAQRVQREADLSLELEAADIQMAATHIQKVAQELISNAFKFSRPGQPVRVTGRVDAGRYLLQVQDYGRGMTAQQIADVGAYLQFERRRHEQQGSGLGLVIVKRLAELQGGELQIDSTPGQQTRVKLVLPLRRFPAMASTSGKL